MKKVLQRILSNLCLKMSSKQNSSLLDKWPREESIGTITTSTSSQAACGSFVAAAKLDLAIRERCSGLSGFRRQRRGWSQSSTL